MTKHFQKSFGTCRGQPGLEGGGERNLHKVLQVTITTCATACFKVSSGLNVKMWDSLLGHPVHKQGCKYTVYHIEHREVSC